MVDSVWVGTEEEGGEGDDEIDLCTDERNWREGVLQL